MRPGAPVAVAAVTAWSATATASRLASRRAFLTDLKMLAVARRTVTASGCSGGNDSMSASTCRHVLSLSGSIAFTVEEYGQQPRRPAWRISDFADEHGAPPLMR
jgi:hypothetical protein